MTLTLTLRAGARQRFAALPGPCPVFKGKTQGQLLELPDISPNRKGKWKKSTSISESTNEMRQALTGDRVSKSGISR